MARPKNDEEQGVEINEDYSERCYVCGRNPAEFAETFRLEGFSTKVRQIEAKRQADLEKILGAYLKQLRELLANTSGYQTSVTAQELMENETLSAKLMPRYKALLDFSLDPLEELPEDYDDEEPVVDPRVTIEEMREHLERYIAALEQHEYPPSLERLAPAIAVELDCIPSLETREFHFAPIPFARFETVCYRDVSGREIDNHYSSRLFYHTEDYEPEGIQSVYGSIKTKPKDGVEPLQPNQVLKVTLGCVLCPMCSSMFSRASGAAYRIIHAHDDED